MSLQTKLLIVLGAFVFILGGFTEYMVQKKFFPVTTSIHSDTTITTIKPTDTAKTVVVRDSVKVTKEAVVKRIPKKDAPIVIDTGVKVVAKTPGDTADSVTVIDTAICYNFQEQQFDTANIKVKICSESLPAIKPLDLSIHIEYLPPPKHVKTITNDITNTVYKPIPFYKDWKSLLAIAVSCFIGYQVGHK